MNKNLNRESAENSLSHEVHCGTESPPGTQLARIVTGLSRFLTPFSLPTDNEHHFYHRESGQKPLSSLLWAQIFIAWSTKNEWAP
jgi:hypothetical protein